MKLLLLSLSLTMVLCQRGHRSPRYSPPTRHPAPHPGPRPTRPTTTRPGYPHVSPSGCKHWCRRYHFGQLQYYCCDHSPPDIYEPTRPPPQKICPPSPGFCKSYHSKFSAPIPCYSSSQCSTVDLCCYDVCLKHKTCKTADYVGK